MKTFLKEKTIRFFPLLLLLALLSACNKEDSMLSTDLPEPLSVSSETAQASNRSEGHTAVPSVLEGRVVFDSEDHFNDYLQVMEDYLNPEEADDDAGGVGELSGEVHDLLDAWEDQIGFVSYRKDFLAGLSEEEIDQLDALPVDDEILSTLLNPDGIVQISPWIFRLEPVEEKVYAIKSTATHLLGALTEKPEEHPEIFTFSFEDDVFELLDEQVFGLFKKCKDSKANKQVNEDKWSYCEDQLNNKDWTFKLKVKYSSFGIKKSLYFKMEHWDGKLFNGDQRTKVNYLIDAAWKPKCKSVDTKLVSTFERCKSGKLKMKHNVRRGVRGKRINIYNKTRSLNGYYATVIVRFINRCKVPNTLDECTSFFLTEQTLPVCITDNWGNFTCPQ